MILAGILVIPFLGGVLAWLIGRRDQQACRWVALAALLADLAFILSLCVCAKGRPDESARWIAESKWTWIAPLGVSIHLGADGLTFLLLLLAAFLGMVAIGVSWNEIRQNVGFFHFNLMLVLTGVMGVFLSLDLFLFYVFWEMMLVPMYFLISMWGHERRVYAAVKFFIFTQLGGLFMLVAVLGLYFVHGRSTGDYTFDYTSLLTTKLSGAVAFWLMMGFIAAFFVKLPAVPLHTWLADAHTEAPTAGSILLAGLLLKTGAYGIIRFVLPLFPTTSRAVAPVAMALGVAGILYGAILAFSQTDLKRLIAYTSISHLGFVLLGAFAGTKTALQGSIILIIAHGLSTGGLFAVAGVLQERLNTRKLDALGGLWAVMPRLGGVALFFSLASLGLPGLANFVGEFLVLAGSYKANPALTVVASVGFIASAVYSLWLIYRVFHGPQQSESRTADLNLRETVVFGSMIALIVMIGLWPQPILDTAAPVLESLEYERARGAGSAALSVIGKPASIEPTARPVQPVQEVSDDIE
jgi:NADH-quinone oxidoreductase subunit M